MSEDTLHVAAVERVEVENVQHVVPISSTGASSDLLLMTCGVRTEVPGGYSASFISVRLANSLSLRRCSRTVNISGIAGLSHHTQNHITTLRSTHVTWQKHRNYCHCCA